MACEVFELDELVLEQHQLHEALRCLLHTIIFHRALGLVRPKTVDSELFDISYVQCSEVDVNRRVDERIAHLSAWMEKHPQRKMQVCLSFYNPQMKATWKSETGKQVGAGVGDAAAVGSVSSSNPSSLEGHVQSVAVTSPSGVPSSPISSSGQPTPLSSSPTSSWFSSRLAPLSPSPSPCLAGGQPWEQWLIPLSLVNTAGTSPTATSAGHISLGSVLGGAGEGARFAPSAAHGCSGSGNGSGSYQKQVEVVLRSSMLAILQAVNQRHTHIPPVLTAGPLSFPFDITISSASEATFGVDVLKRILLTAPHGVLG